ncbi:hypothetical protein CSV67_02940 [Sporosarcina sp. P2]|uniref:hypothetical protein n=1 Tax=Sporosarcina sp. P2 TaxID=2048251 RepID=UPI000C1687C0|nr:hypothetical protein [Sporosarcina sp. P2]PID03613.1 hypothetical protein CSV67_02940 [Sporosarcina sp. P2]
MPENKGENFMVPENENTDEMKTRKESADILRDIAELLVDPTIAVEPMNISIKQFRGTVAEFENGKSIVQLTRDISIEIETREIIKNL